MGQYSHFLGKRVEVFYRVSDIHLSAIATLVADTGDRISLEDRVSQGGKEKTIRTEIPYEYLLRISEVKAQPPSTPRGTQ
jgi:hypothetical protein